MYRITFSVVALASTASAFTPTTPTRGIRSAALRSTVEPIISAEERLALEEELPPAPKYPVSDFSSFYLADPACVLTPFVRAHANPRP